MKKELSEYKVKLEDISWKADPAEFNFKSTAEIEPPKNPIDIVKGQEKAKEVILRAIKLRENVLMFGLPGCGKSLLAKTVAEQFSKENPHHIQLEDQVLVHNFENEWEPLVIKLPTPKGQEFRQDIVTLRQYLPDMISKGYTSLIGKQEKSEKKEKIDIEKILDTKVQIDMPPEGLMDILGFRKKKELTTVQKLISLAQKQGASLTPNFKEILEDYAHNPLEAPIIESRDGPDFNLSLEELYGRYNPMTNQTLAFGGVTDRAYNNIGNVSDIIEKYKDNEKITKYIQAMIKDLEENAKFLGSGSSWSNIFGGGGGMQPMEKKALMDKYTANLIVDNSEIEGLPIMDVEHPSIQNILGEAGHDAYNIRPPHTRVKAGKLHRGHGGVVIIDELIVALQDPIIKNYLLTVLQEKKGRIGGGSGVGGGTSAGIETEPAHADCIIIGCANEDIAQYLTPKIIRRFRHRVQFESAMENTKEARYGYAEFVKYEIDLHNKDPKNANNQVPHLSPEAVAALVELGVRFAQTTSHGKTKLTNILDPLGGITKQASAFAAAEKAEVTSRAHVMEAEKTRTLSMVQQQNESVKNILEGLILLSTEGEQQNIINGLTVTQDKAGLVAFGRPVRVIATTSKSTKLFGIHSAEKDVGLGKEIHNKALGVINGYFNNLYGQEVMEHCYATISFAQMYNPVDGDSASIATILALKSAMAKVPIKQNFAVTGSVNELGEIQAIGGVNEKIEGFYQVCKQKKLTGSQGVVIPKANVKDLMLNEEVVNSYEKGEFSVYAVEHVSEAEEIMMEVSGNDLDKIIKNSYKP